MNPENASWFTHFMTNPEYTPIDPAWLLGNTIYNHFKFGFEVPTVVTTI
jgi:hypothetical protein